MPAKKILLFLSLVIWFANISYAETTIILASGEWSPYQSSQLQQGGFVTQIIREAFALSDIKVEINYFPWSRSFKTAKDGEWDGTFIWFDTIQRREEFYISDPIVNVTYVFFHLKSCSFDWHSINDLKGIRVGATKEYEFGGDEFKIAEQNKTINVIRSYSDSQNFSLLKKKRIQVFPCDYQVGYQLIQDIFSTQDALLFTHHKKPIKSAQHHLLLSKKNTHAKEWITLFNNGLNKLKISGRYQQIIQDQTDGKFKQ